MFAVSLELLIHFGSLSDRISLDSAQIMLVSQNPQNVGVPYPVGSFPSSWERQVSRSDFIRGRAVRSTEYVFIDAKNSRPDNAALLANR